MRTFYVMWGPHRELTGSISFAITVLPDHLDKIRTFPLVWAPHRELSGPTSFKIKNVTVTLRMDGSMIK